MVRIEDRAKRNRDLLDPERCRVCAEIQTSGYSPTPHCRTCHAIWTGTRIAHCMKCHRTFGSNATADLAHSSYRDADDELQRRCHDPATRGLHASTNDHGTTVWRSPPPSPERLSALRATPKQGRKRRSGT